MKADAKRPMLLLAKRQLITTAVAKTRLPPSQLLALGYSHHTAAQSTRHSTSVAVGRHYLRVSALSTCMTACDAHTQRVFTQHTTTDTHRDGWD